LENKKNSFIFALGMPKTTKVIRDAHVTSEAEKMLRAANVTSKPSARRQRKKTIENMDSFDSEHCIFDGTTTVEDIATPSVRYGIPPVTFFFN
jgi:hypothetical protein